VQEPLHIDESKGRRWARIQAASGLVFLGFLVGHLLNVALAALGPETFNGVQRTLRVIYQNPWVEVPLVLGSLGVHVTAGIVRMRMRRGTSGKLPTATRVHRLAGLFLLVSVFGHIAATRLPSVLRDVYPEFEGVAFTFDLVPWFFYPYYPLLGLAGVLHGLLGVRVALGVLGVKLPQALRRGPGLWFPIAASAILVTLGVAALGGLLFEFPDPSEHPFARLLREFYPGGRG
jgi:succinate dehydrogenase/fumarate reductase cytochrome b subunit